MPRLIYIYTLSDPKTGRVRYVGKTVQLPKNRLTSHISTSKHNRKKDYCHCWIKSLLNEDLKPIMNIIEETYDVNRETYWINYYRNKEEKLTNFTDGGELGNLGKTWKLSPDKIKSKATKKVYLLNKLGDLIKVVESVKQFCKIYKCSDGHATYIISNHVILDDGLIPSYADKLNKKPQKKRYKSVILYEGDNIKEFETVKDAAKYLKVDNSTLCKYLRGERVFVKNPINIKYKCDVNNVPEQK